jgi:hypothetical protein
VVHVAIPGLPDVTVLVPHPVFALQVTVPVSPEPDAGVIVAVKVTLCPYGDGFGNEVTAVVVLVWVMLKLLVCGLLAAL